MLSGLQRKLALRVGRAYTTVSLEAALVVAGMIPIDLLIRERGRISRADGDTITIARREREKKL